MVSTAADAYAPGPPQGTYGLRVLTCGLRAPASRVVYVPEAQGGLPPGPHALYALGARTRLGRAVRTAHRGTPGCDKSKLAGMLEALLAGHPALAPEVRQMLESGSDADDGAGAGTGAGAGAGAQ